MIQNSFLTSHPHLTLAGEPRNSEVSGRYPDKATAPENERLADQARKHLDEALLASRVRNRLLDQLKLDALPIRVTAQDATITLAGDVRQNSARDSAELAALSVGGVKEINNLLNLADGGAAEENPAPGERADGDAISDALLEARLKIRLLTRGGPEAFHIHVEATDGVVILSGGVPDEAHLDKALRITLATVGVREIHDLLEVRRTAHRRN